MRQNQTNTAIRPPPEKSELFDVLAALLTSDEAPKADDMALYMAELDELDMPADQKTELIHTLWQIVQSLVRIRFGFDPALDVIADRKIPSSDACHPMLNSADTNSAVFDAAANGRGGPHES